MSNTFEPRQTDPNSWKLWMRDGGRLLWRVSGSWMILWFLVAVVALFLFGNSPIFFLAVALSMPIFDLHLTMIDRAAKNQEGIASAALDISQALGANLKLYARSAAVRIAWTIALLFLQAAIMLALKKASGAPETPPSNPVIPPWIQLFGINWIQWSWVWLLPAAWQRGGFTSFNPWLNRRMGMSPEMASHFNAMARRKNPMQLLHLSMALLGLGCLSLIALPILLPLVEIYAVAVLRCAYHDIFDGGTKIEAPVSAETRAMVPA